MSPPTGGYVAWDHTTLATEPTNKNFYFGTRWFSGWVPLGFQRNPSLGATVIPTHASTHKVHLPFTGLVTPSQMRSYTFSFEWLADSQQDWYDLKAASVSKRVIDFCPVLWEVDEFSPVVDEEEYRLSRRTARSVIAAITSITHPDAFTLDGADAPSAATISGQTLTADASGTVLVARYVPVYRVVVSRFDEAIAEINDMRANVELTEVIQE